MIAQANTLLVHNASFLPRLMRHSQNRIRLDVATAIYAIMAVSPHFLEASVEHRDHLDHQQTRIILVDQRF